MSIEQVEKDLKVLLDYIWHDEKKHYVESGYSKDHIFRVIKRLAKRIEYRGETKSYFSWKLV